jgi:O-antigen/teichoic acid export membrane protein
VFPTPIYEPKTWIKAGLPMILVGSMHVVNSNADILLLGALAGTDQAGLYKAAARGAELLTYSLIIVSAPLGPVIARLHAAGQFNRLQSEIVRWARLAFVPTLLLAAALILYGDWFLGLFGPEFVTEASPGALAILATGQLVHAGAGPVALLLIMTGHRNVTAAIMTIAALCNVFLNLLLIPTWGITGAAFATALTTGLFALLLFAYSIVKLQINPSILPILLPPLRQAT